MNKLFDKKDVYSWSNAEDAKKYIGKEGYFVNSFYLLERDIVQQYTSRLVGVDTTEVCCFKTKDCGDYFLFLPVDKVKKPEKKWRAFRTFEEFILVLGTIGCHVRFRYKDDISNEFLALIVGFNYEAQTVTINNSIYSFKELFKKFEFYKNQEWQPFGMLENES